jgi:hypothetical protein
LADEARERGGLATADLEELLRSPLDDPPEPLPRWVRYAAVSAGVILVVIAGWIIFGGDNETATVASEVPGATETAAPEAPGAGTPTDGSAPSPATTAAPVTTTLAVTPGFPDVGFASVSLDPDRGVLAFGGTTPTGTPSDATWLWDAGAAQWLELDLLDRPPERVGAPAASLESGTLMFGGGATFQLISACQIGFCPPIFYGDTLLVDLDEGSWRLLQTPNAPSERNGAAMVAVPDRDIAVLYGGVGPPEGGERTGVLHDDTWIYDPAAEDWRQVDTDVAPSARASHAMVYDPATDMVYMWGGRAESTTEPPEDLWAFDPATETWSEVDVQGESPTARWTHRWILEPESESLIMSGGQFFEDGSQAHDPAMWSFDPSTSSWAMTGPELPDDVSLIAADGTGGVIAVTHDGTVRWDAVAGADSWQLVAEPPE